MLRIHETEFPVILHGHECDVTGLLLGVDLEILCVPIKIIIIGWWIATRAKPTNKLLSVMPIMGNWISAFVKTMLPLFIVPKRLLTDRFVMITIVRFPILVERGSKHV